MADTKEVVQKDTTALGVDLDELDDLARPAVYARNFAILARFLKQGRMLTYASEAGESGRPVLPPFAIKLLYGISFGYVGLDLVLKGYEAREHGFNKAALKVADAAIWHGFASIVLPAVTIHTFVSASQKAIQQTLPSNPKAALWLPVAVGLGSIPLIIHPIDKATDIGMDNTIRLLYKDHLVKVPSDHHGVHHGKHHVLVTE